MNSLYLVTRDNVCFLTFQISFEVDHMSPQATYILLKLGKQNLDLQFDTELNWSQATPLHFCNRLEYGRLETKQCIFDSCSSEGKISVRKGVHEMNYKTEIVLDHSRLLWECSSSEL